MSDDPDQDPDDPSERTVDMYARMSDAELFALRQELEEEMASSAPSGKPKSPYQSAAYRDYRYGQWIRMIDEELASRR